MTATGTVAVTATVTEALIAVTGIAVCPLMPGTVLGAVLCAVAVCRGHPGGKRVQVKHHPKC